MERTINYSADELKQMNGSVRDMTSERHVLYYDGKPLIENLEANELHGEVFRKGIINGKEVEASNYGRIRISGMIVPQIEKSIDSRGYLIPNYIGLENICVYNIVAEIWLGRHDDMQVHHITNNGYDNRPENLIYLSKDDHEKVHANRNNYFLNYRIDIYSAKIRN